MIKTGAQYLDDMQRMKPSIYMMGEKVENYQKDHRFRSSFNLVALNHDICFDEKYRDLAVCHEPFVDEPVRRFTHKLQTTQEDSLKKAQLTRQVCRHHICGWCMSNSLCILWTLTHDIDRKYGTEYHQRFQEFAGFLMKNDYDCFWAMMNPKGDRSLKLDQQKQGSPGVKIVKKDKKGIVVRGAKVSNSYATCSLYTFAVPCTALTEGEKDYAVAFAVPSDEKGVHFIVRPAPNRDSSAPGHDMENPIGSEIGIVEGTVVFDDVFVPWERVFMCGEWDMAGQLPFLFSNIHRQSKCACLAGHTDLVCGVASLVADVNGTARISHIREKITHLMTEAEVAYGCSLGAAMEGQQHPGGIFIPSTAISNAGVTYIKKLTGEQIQLLHDVSGGIICTMPVEADYRNPVTRKWMDDYLFGNARYTTEERLRALYLAQEIASSKFTGYFIGWGVNAAGSPAACDIFVRSHYDLKGAVGVAREWAKISTGKPPAKTSVP